MRQGQQGRRGRGRSRKVQSPLSRNFESNGPDVKIRGTANHIAEKYAALARDAMASGDTVMAENYLQHAEHYNRIIMAAQAQLASAGTQPGDGANGAGGGRGRRGPSGDGGARPEASAEPDAANSANETAQDAPKEAAEDAGAGEAQPSGRSRAGSRSKPKRDSGRAKANGPAKQNAGVNGSEAAPDPAPASESDADSEADTDKVPPGSVVA